MSKDGNGFYKRRRGVVEHLEAGIIDLLDLAIHDYLNLKANLVIGNGFPWPAGVVFTSAIALASFSKDISERTIQRRFQKLEELGWIKTWQVPGKHGNYPVLICRASVHDMSGNEYRVNGLDTKDWHAPVYESVGDVSVTCRGDVGEVSTLREVENREEEKRRENTSSTPQVLVALGSPEFLEFWNAYPKRVDRKEALRSWIKGLCDMSLGNILAGLEKWKATEQWGDYDKIPYPSTWLNKRRWNEAPETLSKSEWKARKTDEAIERVRARLHPKLAAEAK